MYHRSATLCHGTGQKAGGGGIEQLGFGFVALGTVDGCVGSTVDNAIHSFAFHQRINGIGIGYVEFFDICENIMMGGMI